MDLVRHAWRGAVGGLAVGAVIAMAAVAAPAAATPKPTPSECAAASDRGPGLVLDQSPNDTVDAREEAEYQRWTAGRATAATAGVDITVYVHNFHERAAGRVTYQQVLDTLAHLNAAYSGGQAGPATRFEFKLGAYENIRVGNSRINVTSARGNRLARAQHEGGKATLNLFVGYRLSAGSTAIAGYGTPPWWVDNRPKLDGVWIRHDVMAGVPGGPTGVGADAVVHEVGHWLGLYHVFQGYCNGRGDQVADTGRMSRRSAANRDSCRARNTCDDDGGLGDPVRNFMSYSYDRCMNRFTPGQVARMSNQWDRHRA